MITRVILCARIANAAKMPHCNVLKISKRNLNPLMEASNNMCTPSRYKLFAYFGYGFWASGIALSLWWFDAHIMAREHVENLFVEIPED